MYLCIKIGKDQTMKQTFILAILAVLLFSCHEDEDSAERDKTDFLQYAFYEKNNPQNKSEAFLIQDGTIHIMAVQHSDLTSLIPEYTINGRDVYIEDTKQRSGWNAFDFSDFTNPITYRVESSQGEEKDWTVNVYDLPVMMINTPDGEPIVDKEVRKEGCTVKLVNLDGSIDDLGTAGIRGRGNTTWVLDKKPYNVKFDNKHAILGMNESKNWVLLANCYYDRTQLHNATAFEMARLTDFPWVQSGRFVELILNGTHLGLYYLCEKIRVENDKINITEMDPEDLSGEALTGGYLLESYVDLGDYYFDGYPFQTDYFNRTGYNLNCWLAWEIKDPEGDFSIPKEQLDYIKSAMNKMESLIYDDSKLMTGAYRDYLDIETAINWYLVQELSTNEETTRTKNLYLYKDRNDKFRLGPPWDFDAWSFGQSAIEWHNCNNWCFYYRQLLKDPVFVQRLKEKWAIYKPLWEELIPLFIDTHMNMILRSALRNEQMWTDWTDENLYPTFSYEVCVGEMKKAFYQQLYWLDAQISAY